MLIEKTAPSEHWSTISPLGAINCWAAWRRSLLAPPAATGTNKNEVGTELPVVTVDVTVAVTVEVAVAVVRRKVGALLITMFIPPVAWIMVFC